MWIAVVAGAWLAISVAVGALLARTFALFERAAER
jgi:hypothetical protein